MTKSGGFLQPWRNFIYLWITLGSFGIGRVKARTDAQNRWGLWLGGLGCAFP